jgi:hypothetical protein
LGAEDMAGLDVEKWDARLDNREDASVIREAGVKWDRGTNFCPAFGGVE